jgi:hypothetical protein
MECGARARGTQSPSLLFKMDRLVGGAINLNIPYPGQFSNLKKASKKYLLTLYHDIGFII